MRKRRKTVIYVWILAFIMGLFGGIPMAEANISVPTASYNPIIKQDGNGNPLFTADPAVMVDGDTLYLYVGRDEAAPGSWFYMREWLVYSTKDMLNWKYEGRAMRSADFQWATSASAWAAHVVKKGGKYYFYATVDRGGGRGNAIGVAVADHPAGPFTDAVGGPLFDNAITTGAPTNSMEDIDPAVFIDDDGQAYLYWGNGVLHYALLNADMISIKDLNGDGRITEGADIFTGVPIRNLPGRFSEAPWVHKAGGKYYLTFAMDLPQKVAYATSNSPLGPWEYKGLILRENSGPGGEDIAGTSHPAVASFLGKTYVFYHTAALPTGDHHRRSVSVEEIFYNADGTIQEAYMSSTGPFGVKSRLQSHRYPDRFARFAGSTVRVEAGNPLSLPYQWELVQGLAGGGTSSISIQAVNKPGYYLRVSGNSIVLAKHNGTAAFRNEATFNKVPGLADSSWVSFQSIADPAKYIRQSDAAGSALRLDSYSGASSLTDRRDATFSLAAETGQAPPVVSGSVYKLKNAHSSKVMGVQSMSAANGARAVQWDDTGTADHRWRFDLLSNGYYKLTNLHSGKVLGVENMSTANGARAVQWDDNGTADHEWQLVAAGNGGYKLVNRHSGKVLGVENMSTANGASVVQWDDNGTADHGWSFLPVAP